MEKHFLEFLFYPYFFPFFTVINVNFKNKLTFNSIFVGKFQSTSMNSQKVIAGFLVILNSLLIFKHTHGQNSYALNSDSLFNYAASTEASFFLSYLPSQTLFHLVEENTTSSITFLKKDTLIQITNKVMQQHQLIEEVHTWPNGQTRMKRYYSTGSPYGNWYYYNSEGAIKYEFRKTPKGKESFIEYYPNGQIKFIETKTPNQYKVSYQSFYQNGAIYEVGSLFQSSNSLLQNLNYVRHGRWKVHFPSGEIKLTGKYNTGKRVGKWSFFSFSGKCEREIYYKQGVLKKQQIHE